MPAYNAGPYIEESIRSVLGQDYQNIELIVVDDGSKDGTPELAEQFGNRVKILRQKNAGPAAARNRGIAAASGELIAFLDADDVWLPGKVTLQVRYLLANPDVGVVYGIFLRWYAQPDGTFLAPPPSTISNAADPFALVAEHSGWVYRVLLLGSVLHIITAMIRRSVVEQVGNLDESLPTGEDYDFWLRVSQQFRADKLDRTLTYYRMHTASTTTIPRRENNEYKVLLKALATFGHAGPDGVKVSDIDLKRRLFEMCFSHGYFHFWGGDPKVAQEAFRVALKYSPLKPKIWAYWALAGLKSLVK